MPVVLLAFLSAMVVLLPAADVIPGSVQASQAAARAGEHNRLVVFLIDGLGARKAFEPGVMPGVQARFKKSAHGVGIASFPTITPPGLRSVFSGRHALPEPEVPGGLSGGLEADSVLKRASVGGLKVMAVGQFNWEPIFHGHGAVIKTVPYHGESILYGHEGRKVQSDYDQRVLAEARPWVDGKHGKWDLLILHLFEADPIGHAVGTEDAAYDGHLRWLDSRITEVATKLEDQAPTTFMLVADHGMTASGTHGGMSPAERQVPFVLWGAGVTPGQLAPRPLLDAAPTITAILGVPPPAGSEGLPAMEALALAPERRAFAWSGVLAQRAERFTTVSRILPWLHGDPASVLPKAEKLEKEGSFDAAARLLEHSVREADRRFNDALPEKWLGRLIVAVWCLVVAAGLSLAWPPHPRAKRAATLVGTTLLLAAAAPLVHPAFWSWSSGLVEAAAIAMVGVALSAGLAGGSSLGRAGWAAWTLAMIALCWQDVFDVNLWSGLVLTVWLGSLLWKRRGSAAAVGMAALALSVFLRDWRPDAYLSLARALLPGSLVALSHWKLRAVTAAAVAALLWSLRRSLADAPRASARRQVALAALAPAVALALPGGGVRAGWALLACAASTAAAFVWCAPATRGRCLSLVAVGFFASLATPIQACALTLACAVGWAAGSEDDAHPLLAGLTLLALALWSFSISGGRLRHLAITVEEGHRALGNAWYPRLVVALLLLKYAVGAGAPLLPRLGTRSLRTALGVLPPLGALGAGFMTSLWWDRFMQGGNVRFTTQVSYVGLVSTVVVGWVICALWAATRAGRSLAPRALSADPV